MKRQWFLRQRLSSRRSLIGLLQMGPNPPLIDQAGRCGYDFMLLDAEHGDFRESDYRETLNALGATDVLAMVRLASHDPGDLSRFLELGVDAVVAPHVSNADEARALASTVAMNDGVSLLVIIESALGVANVEEIFALEGVAGALVGPNDLTSDLGRKGDYGLPAYAAALASVERAAAAANKVVGTAPHGSYSLEVLHARGHRMFVLATDRSLLSDALSAQAAKAQLVLSSRDRSTKENQ